MAAILKLLLCLPALLVGCSTTNRAQYFSELRNKHAVADEFNMADDQYQYFDGLVQIILLDANRSDLQTLIGGGLLPQLALLNANGLVSDSSPPRYVYKQKMIGLDAPTLPLAAGDQPHPHKLNTFTFEFSKNLSCLAKESAANRKSAMFITNRDHICINRQWLQKELAKITTKIPAERVATYMLNDLMLEHTLKSTGFRRPLILINSATSIHPAIDLTFDKSGQISPESLIILQNTIQDLEARAKGFLPLRIALHEPQLRPSFAELVQLRVNSEKLPELLQKYLGPGFLIVPYDTTSRQKRLLQNLIVQNQQARRSRIQFDYGRLLRFHLAPLTPIGALDLEQFSPQQFRYFSEEEWHLMYLQKENPDLEIVPAMAHIMMELNDIDLGFFVNRNHEKPTPLFAISSLTTIPEKTRGQLGFIPTLRNLNRLTSQWIFHKKNQDQTVLGHK